MDKKHDKKRNHNAMLAMWFSPFPQWVNVNDQGLSVQTSFCTYEPKVSNRNPGTMMADTITKERRNESLRKESKLKSAGT